MFLDNELTKKQKKYTDDYIFAICRNAEKEIKQGYSFGIIKYEEMPQIPMNCKSMYEIIEKVKIPEDMKFFSSTHEECYKIYKEACSLHYSLYFSENYKYEYGKEPRRILKQILEDYDYLIENGYAPSRGMC